MKRLLLSMSVLAITAATAATAKDLVIQTVPSSMYASEVPGDFYFSLEAVAAGRSSTSTVLGQDTSGAGALFSTRDLAAIGWGGGVQFTFGAKIDGVWGVELHGLGLGNFTSTGERIAAGETLHAAYSSTVTPANMFFANSEDAYAARFTESSSLGSLEASATYDMGEFKLFFGPRVLRYQAALGSVFFDELADYTGADNDIDRIDISTTNTLVGAQLGLSGMYDLNDMFSVGGRAAVGLYANHATLSRSFTADDGGSPLGAAASSTSTAIGFAQSLEFSPKLNVAVTENLDLTLGATWLWLNGVDEPGNHYAGMGAAGGVGVLAADSPTFTNGVNFGGITAGLHGQF